MPDDSELDRIDPQPAECKLSTGFALEVVRMRTRQFFRLLRVLTHGAGPALMQSSLNFDSDDPGQFAAKLLTLTVMSIPDAEQEAIAYLASMCRPAGLTDKPASQLTKQESENNQVLWDRFNEEMHNPDPADTIDLVEIIIRQEAPELQSLGKKLRQVFELFRKTGQDRQAPEAEPEPQDLNSPERSPRRSTSSATSTAGQTSTSSNSPSAGSGSASKRRASAGDKSS
jgi:hypothetical protein